jgi:hypothetical protein
MSISQPDASPFLFVWYVFLGFLLTIVAVQLLMVALTAGLRWYNQKLFAKYSVNQPAIKPSEES